MKQHYGVTRREVRKTMHVVEIMKSLFPHEEVPVNGTLDFKISGIVANSPDTRIISAHWIIEEQEAE